jgi:hypothetical protein
MKLPVIAGGGSFISLYGTCEGSLDQAEFFRGINLFSIHMYIKGAIKQVQGQISEFISEENHLHRQKEAKESDLVFWLPLYLE